MVAQAPRLSAGSVPRAGEWAVPVPGVPVRGGGRNKKDRGVPWRFAWLYLIAGSEFRQASTLQSGKAELLA